MAGVIISAIARSIYISCFQAFRISQKSECSFELKHTNSFACDRSLCFPFQNINSSLDMRE